MLAEALEHLVRGVVDHPDDVVVRDKQLRRGSILEVRVHPDDLGKVIGRGGRTATAFRTVDLRPRRPRRRADRLRRRRPAPLSQHRPSTGVDPTGVAPVAHCVAPVRAMPVDRGSTVGGETDGDERSTWTTSRSSSAGSASRTACAARSPSTSAPTSPSAASPPGPTLRGEPPAGVGQPPDRADRRRAPAGTSPRCWSGSRSSPTAPPPRRRAASCCTPPSPADETPEDPDEFYDHQLVGLAAYDLDGTPLGDGQPASCTAAPRTCSQIRTPDGRDALVPFVAALVPEVDLAGGRVVVADRPGPGRRRSPRTT